MHGLFTEVPWIRLLHVGGTPGAFLPCQNLIPNQESSREEEFVPKEQQPCKPGDRNIVMCFASLSKAILGAFSPPIPSFYPL